eukprot:Awhi_evm1s4660
MLPCEFLQQLNGETKKMKRKNIEMKEEIASVMEATQNKFQVTDFDIGDINLYLPKQTNDFFSTLSYSDIRNGFRRQLTPQVDFNSTQLQVDINFTQVDFTQVDVTTSTPVNFLMIINNGSAVIGQILLLIFRCQPSIGS